MDSNEFKCPCKRTDCIRFGKCDECREHHKNHRRYKEPFCERKKKGRLRERRGK